MAVLNALVHRPISDVLDVGLADEEALDRITRFVNDVDPQVLPPRARCVWEAVGDVRDGLTAAVYHRLNVFEIEQDLAEACRIAYAIVPEDVVESPITMAVPAKKLAYEYHAFLFAIRRTLEYLARGLANYFDRSSKSFRRLPKALDGAPPPAVSDAVVEQLSKSLSALDGVLSRPDERAPRDRVAHTRPEEPGTLNIKFFPEGNVVVHLVGGAEDFDLSSRTEQSSMQLASLLEERCELVERVAIELLARLPEFKEAAVAALA